MNQGSQEQNNGMKMKKYDAEKKARKRNHETNKNIKIECKLIDVAAEQKNVFRRKERDDRRRNSRHFKLEQPHNSKNQTDNGSSLQVCNSNF